MKRALLVLLALGLVRCGGATSTAPGHPALPDHPRGHASQDFWTTWSDGNAELSSYDCAVPRYGAMHPAELVLVYVTEPLDRQTLIKDDSLDEAERLNVLKLNVSLKFQTGVYPYSVMTSVFAPVDAYGAERFQPVKIALSAQEWCGSVFAAVWPDAERFELESRSYFASEGETHGYVAAPRDALYEDALLIQLRELDGPFAGGRDWQGALVPGLWRNRRAHVALESAPGRIVREDRGDTTRFVLTQGEFVRTFDVEKGGERRVLGWTTSDGEHARIRQTARLPYWELHDVGEETERARFGLEGAPLPTAEPAEGTVRIGF